MKRLIAIVVFLAATHAGFRIANLRRRTSWLFAAQALMMGTLIGFERAELDLPLVSICLFCVTLGLQNGVITAVHNLSLHTTFLSGDFTKLLEPSQETKSATNQGSPRLLQVLIAGFAVGAFLAAMVHHLHPGSAIAAFLLVLTLAFGTTLLPAANVAGSMASGARL